MALADAGSSAHDSVRSYLETAAGAVLVPVTVLPEADYLVTRRLGIRAEQAMLRAVATGYFQLEDLMPADLARSIELIEQYADSKIGLVDASIVAIAERLRITRILTLDARHFRMFRPRHCETFDLVP